MIYYNFADKTEYPFSEKDVREIQTPQGWVRTVDFDRFVDWLKKTSKMFVDEAAALADLVAHCSSCAVSSYELSGYETKSGNPEVFSLDIVYEPMTFDGSLLPENLADSADTYRATYIF